jgi:hypothetical protein
MITIMTTNVSHVRSRSLESLDYKKILIPDISQSISPTVDSRYLEVIGTVQKISR